MSSPMDKFGFTGSPNPQPDLIQVLKQARQNPKAFEEQFKKVNPQAYQQAMQLRNSISNPQQAIMQIAQQRGVNPNILKMLDL